MRAGALSHVIRCQRATATVNDAGTPVLTWAEFAILRAEVVERSTAEFLADGGAVDKGTIVFRTRYFADLTTADRIAFQGALWNVRELRPIGRRQGLEIRCVNVNGA